MADKLDQVAIRMIEQPPLYSDSPMDSPEAAIRVMQEFLSQMDRELFCIVNLQADLKPINMNVVSVGALDHAVTHPREVFKSAILSNAVGILMIHNHPSGSLTPSKADIAVTDRLRQAGAILGIQVYDHIITGRGQEFYSFMQLLLKLDKTNTHVLFELARELIKKKDYQAALELTNQHEAYCKDIAGFYFCRMIIFSKIGELRSAIESAVTYVAKSCKKPVWSMSMLINLGRIKSLFIMNASLVLTMAGEDNMGTDHNQAECNLQFRFYDILRKLLMNRHKHDILEPFWHLYFDPNRRDFPIITDNDEWETII